MPRSARLSIPLNGFIALQGSFTSPVAFVATFNSIEWILTTAGVILAVTSLATLSIPLNGFMNF